MSVPADYAERVYAGVLGKIIGVYLGRPFEGWTHEKIMAELGEVWHYVNDRLGRPLIVTDDDISGTFTFVRALEDQGIRRDLTAEQIGQTWLNYLIETRTVLWWGGLGNSTEHTAYLRLKNGIPAPRSGSMELNSRTVAEQIGAQIFIDGWAMVCPGDPAQAADFARKAASVSHDGEAIYGAQVIAAMEAQAFVENNLQKLLDTALAFIPKDCIIRRMIDQLRELREREDDWRAAFAWLKTNYGYDKYGGNCHMIPNHGIIQLALLWGEDDFQRSLMIANTCGWDTDCNSGNVGCLMGIRNGLAGIDAGADFRTPVADRIYLSTADGGRAITDAVRETYALVNMGRALAGEKPIAPKNGARYHFELPGSVKGFSIESGGVGPAPASIENVARHSRIGTRTLAIRYRQLAPWRSVRIITATHIPPESLDQSIYDLLACPTLYSGQTVEAELTADPGNELPVSARLFIRHYDAGDKLQTLRGEAIALAPQQHRLLRWEVPDTAGFPIAQVGIEVDGRGGANGSVYLDRLTWSGEPRLTLARPEGAGLFKGWRRAWVDGVHRVSCWGPEDIRLGQDDSTRGLLIYGTREWRNYQVSVPVTPHMVTAAGVAVRVQGMRRYYALLLSGGGVELVKVRDNRETVLGEARLDWQLTQTYELSLAVQGNHLSASVNGERMLEASDGAEVLADGAIALVGQEGRCGFGPVRISGLSTTGGEQETEAG